MKTILPLKSIIFNLLILSTVAVAQMELQTNFSSVYDNNVNSNSLNSKSMVSLFNLNSGYKWENETAGIRLFYEGSFSYISSLPERTNSTHSGHVEYTHLYGEDNQNILNMGSVYGLGLNRDNNSVFDHSLFTAYLNYKHFPSEWYFTNYGYQLKSMQFRQLSDLSYTEHSVFISGTFSISGTTTLILQSDLGSKYYSNNISSEIENIETGSSLMPSVTQFTGMIKVGQGLSENLGISLTSTYQWNLQKQSRFLSSDYGLISDDEIFDDHYGYEGLHSNLMFTALLSESTKLELAGGIQNKEYSTLAAHDMEGNIIANQRIDTKYYLGLQLHQKLESLGFNLSASVNIINNKSNDVFYNYSNSSFGFEIDVPF